jgi:DNA-directed RNA polymerase subunit RPC12/RpoP
MADPIPFRCPQCGSEAFKTSTKPTRASDLEGAVCPNCGHKISEDEIRTHAKDIADKLVRDLLRKPGKS